MAELRTVKVIWRYRDDGRFLLRGEECRRDLIAICDNDTDAILLTPDGDIDVEEIPLNRVIPH